MGNKRPRAFIKNTNAVMSSKPKFQESIHLKTIKQNKAMESLFLFASDVAESLFLSPSVENVLFLFFLPRKNCPEL